MALPHRAYSLARGCYPMGSLAATFSLPIACMYVVVRVVCVLRIRAHVAGSPVVGWSVGRLVGRGLFWLLWVFKGLWRWIAAPSLATLSSITAGIVTEELFH